MCANAPQLAHLGNIIIESVDVDDFRVDVSG